MSSEFLSINSFVIMALQLPKSFYLESKYSSYICMQEKHSQEFVVSRPKKKE